MRNFRTKSTKHTLIILISFFYFSFWWIFKIDYFPGLHADEAWAGLKAHQFNTQGVGDLYGMNRYTGSFQPLLCSLVFRIADVGVPQLRVPGIIFNLLALLIIYIALLSQKKPIVLMIFLLMFSQSALYLIAPRVAWEVNTLTLLFTSLFAASLSKIVEEENPVNKWWVGTFLIVNVLGTYNHILFSCISAAAGIGVVLSYLYDKKQSLQKAFPILAINSLNILMVFLAMKYWSNVFVPPKFTILLSLSFLVLFLEIALVEKFLKLSKFIPRIFRVKTIIIDIALAIFLATFILYHGKAFFDVVSNYKLLTHAYSYEFGLLAKAIFLCIGAITCFYLFFYLAEDIKRNGKLSVFAFGIITYLGILSIYTINNSFRYYLSIYVLINLYMAIKIRGGVRRALPLIGSWIIAAIMVNASLIKIFVSSEKEIKAIELVIGNGQVETSAHFLPKEPLISFLKQHKIGQIHYISDRYFLEHPILFYQQIEPWPQSTDSTAVIEYDYTGNNNGYFMLIKRN